MARDANRGKSPQIQQNVISKFRGHLPASYIKDITENFSEHRVIGHSVFGHVYKGDLGDGDIVAVKRFALDALGPHNVFKTELEILMSFRHGNIVQLFGFCFEKTLDVVHHNGRYVAVDIIESHLLYEYLPRGTLDKHLTDAAIMLDWDKRFKIIEGICQGLGFLHNKTDGPLVHMNINPCSIWLDDNWVPKIADFYFSRIFGQEQTRINTMHVMGRNGYMAPEYLYRGEISTKSDIYSLGMLIIEITTGEKNCGSADDRAGRQFVDKVRRDLTTGDWIPSKYSLLEEYCLQQVKTCIKIGLKCVEAERNKRPSIENILNKLDGKEVPIFDEVEKISAKKSMVVKMFLAGNSFIGDRIVNLFRGRILETGTIGERK